MYSVPCMLVRCSISVWVFFSELVDKTFSKNMNTYMVVDIVIKNLYQQYKLRKEVSVLYFLR